MPSILFAYAPTITLKNHKNYWVSRLQWPIAPLIGNNLSVMLDIAAADILWSFDMRFYIFANILRIFASSSGCKLVCLFFTTCGSNLYLISSNESESVF